MKLLAPIVLLLVFALVSPAYGAWEGDPRKPLVYGVCKKPFPAVLNIGYSLCRARAWLTALERAAALLPPAADFRLRQRGLGDRLSRLALCALVAPLDVVTPEKVQGDSIRVFLNWPDDPRDAFDSILANSRQILMEMAVIRETEETVRRLSAVWPSSVTQGNRELARLEELAQELNALWQGAVTPQIAEKDNTPTDSPALLSLRLRHKPDPASLDKLVNRLMDKEVEDSACAVLWNRLAARALYLRGGEHERLHQPALADADYSAALVRLQKFGAEDELKANIYLLRGALRRYDEKQMCADFSAACALGKCQALSLARRDGMCASK